MASDERQANRALADTRCRAEDVIRTRNFFTSSKSGIDSAGAGSA